MLDRTIPFCNTIMKCSDAEKYAVKLPEGFSIVSYQNGDEKEWAKLEYAVGDCGSVQEAKDYFIETYLQNPEMFSDILFMLNRNKEGVGSCIAWQDLRGERTVSSLHWLVVKEQYQGMGLGRALCVAVMNIFAARNAFPVYIHTQPWSWKAILLYLSLGFKLQKTDTFSHYENEYEKAVIELGKIMTKHQYGLLRQATEE